MSIDYLVRRNTQKEDQGKVWGIIGFISQLGYILAYSTSGLATDFVFKPLLVYHAAFRNPISKLLGDMTPLNMVKIGGRAAALVIIIAGIMLCFGALVLSKNKEIKKLEDDYVPETV